MTASLERPAFRTPINLQDAYFSVDVETDGPIPGKYSMLAFALVQAGHHDGRRFVEPEKVASRYWELRPITDSYEQEALEVNGLDRASLSESGADPAAAMREAEVWLTERCEGRRPVMVASPAGFDWMFMHWYFVSYLGSSPFGHSSCFDIKTAVSVRFDRPITMSGRSSVPDWLDSEVVHSHNALDDALEQSQIFANLMAWRGKSNPTAF